MPVTDGYLIKGFLLAHNAPREIMTALQVVMAQAQKGSEPIVVPKRLTATEIQNRLHADAAPTKPAVEPSKPKLDHRSNPDNVWEPWQLDKLVSMKRAGAIASEIATAVNKTTTQVHNKWTTYKSKHRAGGASLGE